MHPSNHARTTPDKPALIMAETGEALSYAELDRISNQGAQFFRALSLGPGSTIAICLPSSTAYFGIVWAAQRAGLYFVTISNKLQADEIEYILRDSGARVFISSSVQGPVAAALAQRDLGINLFSVGQPLAGYRDLDPERAAMPAHPVADEQAGYDMLYSSGTTGRPKGIKPSPICGEPIDKTDSVVMVATKLYGASADTVYLCPAPVYHAAPLRWTMAMMRLGATVVLMEKFDPKTALACIAKHRVTMAQFVPTHFVRMLKMPAIERARHDVSSLRTVVHAAAPCPVPVKEAMMDWLGPIIHEYYSGSEGNGGTFIGPEEWLTHKGSVGRPLATTIHICDENGEELSPRTEGTIYFGGGPQFEYHNDSAKTQESRHAKGWTTLGDIGWVDEDGYLYLTDRKSFMIISGGVNIYPQEIENLLIDHPKVADVAVIGGPDAEMGERVIAVVQPLDWNDAGDALAAELIALAREKLSHVKTPRQVDFSRALPRLDTGKLYKRLIRDEYWAKAKSEDAASG